MTQTAAVAPPRLLPAPQSPYKGLTPFEDTELDALLFFGREREQRVIRENLLAARLTVLYGPSGVGKSSVLRAGVAHELRRLADLNLQERGRPELAVVVFDDWSGDPAARLKAAVREELAALFGSALLDEHEGESLADSVERWTDELACEVLIVLDQTEEYFVYHAETGGFADELPELVTRPGLSVRVLLSIRDDALSKLDRFKGRIPNLFANYLRLDHLGRRAGRSAVLKPVARYNALVPAEERVQVEPALVDALLDQTAEGRVDLGAAGRGRAPGESGRTRIVAPYLQLVLQRVWDEEHASGSRELRLATLERLGGAESIVRDHLRRAVEALAPAEKKLAAQMFRYLVTPSGAKIAHGARDLAEYARVPEREVAPVLSTLVRQRILRPVGPRAGDGSLENEYEIFHDVLAAPVLAWRAQHESDAAVAAARLEAHRRHRRALLVMGVTLAGLAAMTVIAVYAFAQRGEARENAAIAREQRTEAQQQAAIATERRAEALRQAELARVERKRAERQAARAGREERRATEAAEAARANEREAQRLAAVAAAERGRAQEQADLAQSNSERARAEEARAEAQARVAHVERKNAERQATRASRQRRRAEREADRALGRELAASALALVGSDPEEAVRLALRATRLEPTARSEDVLRTALREFRLRGVFPSGGGAIRAAALSHDGAVVVLAAQSGAVRFYRTRTGDPLVAVQHGSPLRSAFISADARFVATAGRDRRVRVWDATGSAVRVLESDEPVNSVELSRDGGLVAITEGGRVGVWDVRTGERTLLTGRLPTPLTGTAFSPDARLLVVVAADRFARVFDVRTGQLVGPLEQQGVVVGAWFSPRGDLLVTGGTRNAYVWSTLDWRRRHLLEGHTRPIDDVAFSGDGERLVTVGDGVPRVWRLDSGASLGTLMGHRHEITAAAFGPDGETIVTASEDGTARIWASPFGNPPLVLAGHDGAVTGVAFAADGRTVLTASDDGHVRLWNPRGDPVLRVLGRFEAPAVAASYSPDGDLVVGAGGNVARLWRAGGGLAHTLRHGGRVTLASFVGRGASVLTASEDGTAALWRARNGARAILVNHGSPIRAAGSTRDGRTLVTAADDGTAKIWTADGRLLRTIRHGGRLLSASFSADGRLLVTAGTDRVARIWSVRDGRAIQALEGHEGDIVAASFDPGARRAVTASADATARVWNVANGRPAFEPLEHVSALTSAVFSPNGSLVLTATAGGDARTWNLRNGSVLRVFRGHVSVVAEARFSPDARWVVTAGPGAGGIWQARSGELFFFLRGHESPLRRAAFAPDSRRVVTAGVDGTVRTYRCDLCARIPGLRSLARQRLAAIVRGKVSATG